MEEKHENSKNKELELQQDENIQRQSEAILNLISSETGPALECPEPNKTPVTVTIAEDEALKKEAGPEDSSSDNFKPDTLEKESDRLAKKRAEMETAKTFSSTKPSSGQEKTLGKDVDPNQWAMPGSSYTGISEQASVSMATQVTDSSHLLTVGGSVEPVEARAISAGDLEAEVRERLKQEAVNAELVEEKSRSKTLYILLGVTFCVVVGAVVGIVVAIGGGNSAGDELEGDLPIFPEIGTDAPTAAPTTVPLTPQQQALLELLEAQESNTPGALKLRTSPQYDASSWMVENDFVAIDDEISNRGELLQLYGVLTFFYSTGEDGSWLENEGWLNPEVPVCDWYPGNLCVPINSIEGRNLEPGERSMPCRNNNE